MAEWAIRDLARATGVTSRTLRHYEQIGLLAPSRTAGSGYRFYGDAEVSRLYRILSLRALEVPLATIALALEDEGSLAEAMAGHLAMLEARRDAIGQQISAVRERLDAVRSGAPIPIEDIFAGIDEGRYEDEVRDRWGDAAWERAARRRARMDEPGRRAEIRAGLAVNSALRRAAEAGEDPAGARFQELVAEHHQWVAEQWGGRAPDAGAYRGLAELYVADPRFAAVYGGAAGAEAVREAMAAWAAANLDAATGII